MSIFTLREAGFDGVTMRYEGQTQVFVWRGKEVRVPPGGDIEQALRNLERDADAVTPIR